MPAPANLVHQTSVSTGTGNLTLTAVNGKQAFATPFPAGTSDEFDYFISNRDAAEWERGTGHVSGGALVRDTVIESTNANAAVNFSAGTKDITNDIPAAKQVTTDSFCLSGLKNKLRNPNFAINQRAVSGTVTLAAGVYGHDGWKAGASGCTYTFSTSGGITTLNISAGSLVQVIEGGWGIDESGTYCLSWTGTAQGNLNAGGSGSSPRTGSLTGGSNATVEFGTGTLAKPQVEMGSTGSAFESRAQIELMLNQRYLPSYRNTSGSLEGMPGVPQFYNATTGVAWLAPFPVPPRVPPTGIVTGALATFRFADVSGAVLGATVGYVSSSSSVSQVNFTTNSAATTNTIQGVGTIGLLANGYIYWTGAEL